MAIVPLARATLRDHVAGALRAAILAGEIAPGSPLVEATLARQFGVSRGTLREALRELVDEGLLVATPYCGTRVLSLSLRDVREIHSMRVVLEKFAFELAWPKRDDGFRDELRRRHRALTAAIDAGDDPASIRAELELHGLVYETAGHGLLLRAWRDLRGRLQLYWAAHHRAHGTRGPRRDSHDGYVAAALGGDLAAMLREVEEHMRRGLETTERFLRAVEAAGPGPATGPERKGEGG